ncbi:MAG: DNA-binding domain-containing protein [Steroidobacteraceae bacterium]|nr:DNA-binding domain-containing protein [Steroidobacteraceae bacterium]
MLPLRELQRRFAASLFGEQIVPDAGLLRSTGISAALRIAIHANNWRQGYREAMALMYPVLQRLVGGEYFVGLADDYRLLQPSRRGDLHHVGAGFPGFLRHRFDAGEYAYLADIAALEWAVEDARRAALVEALTADVLRDLAPDAYADLRLALHPAARLVQSPFPIRRIWFANQSAAESVDTVRLDAGGDALLVRVLPTEVAVAALDEAGFRFVEELGQGVSLGDAAEHALEHDASFDLGAAVRRLFALRALAVEPAT